MKISGVGALYRWAWVAEGTAAGVALGGAADFLEVAGTGAVWCPPLPVDPDDPFGAAAAPAGASSGYFDGLVPRLALSALAGTIFFNFFEMAKPHVTRVLTGMMSGAH
jgi:hypothetical protein